MRGQWSRYFRHLVCEGGSGDDRDGSWSPSCMNIDDLLRIAMERRASDLHLKVGNYPHLRIDGDLLPLIKQARVSPEDMLNRASSTMSARQRQKFKQTTPIAIAYSAPPLLPFRHTPLP